jgi:hypothetical protein
MTTTPPTGLRWSTAAFGDSTDTAPGELCALDQHLQQCQGGHRRWRALGRGAEGLHGFVAPRFITTLALLAVVGALALALL